MKSINTLAASVLGLLVAIAGNEAMAEGNLNLNIVTYQPPAGLIAYINERAPEGVTYNQNGYAGLAEADIVVYFPSRFENRHEITQFGSEILDSGGDIRENSVVVQRSVQHGNRIVYLLYVETGPLYGSEESLKCHANNAIAALSLNFVQDLPLRIEEC